MSNHTLTDGSFDHTKYFETLSADFGQYHMDPANVFLHFVTTPMGLIGALSLIYKYAGSSSFILCVLSVYLLSLLPAVPNGVFVGTVALCAIIVQFVRRLKLSVVGAIAFIVLGYLIQDLAHMGTGEKTFQSTYSAGGHVSCVYLAIEC